MATWLETVDGGVLVSGSTLPSTVTLCAATGGVQVSGQSPVQAIYIPSNIETSYTNPWILGETFAANFRDLLLTGMDDSNTDAGVLYAEVYNLGRQLQFWKDSGKAAIDRVAEVSSFLPNDGTMTVSELYGSGLSGTIYIYDKPALYHTYTDTATATLSSTSVSGGVLVSGSATVSTTTLCAATGGALLGGASLPSLTWLLYGEGGVKVSGLSVEDLIKSSTTYNETMTGGILLGGNGAFLFKAYPRVLSGTIDIAGLYAVTIDICA